MLQWRPRNRPPQSSPSCSGSAVAGLDKSLNRPGGNATGYTLLTNDLEPKRVGLLRELVPSTLQISALLGPLGAAVSARQEIEDATHKSGQRLFVAKVGSDAELDAALRSLIQEQVGAVLVAASAYFDTAATRSLPLRQNTSFRDLSVSRICSRRRLDQLWPAHHGFIPPGWDLCRPHPQGGQACRSAGRAGRAVRVGDQHEDRQCTRSRSAQLHAIARRRGAFGGRTDAGRGHRR